MARTGIQEENKRILMDLEVVQKSHDCPHIVTCYGTFVTEVCKIVTCIIILSPATAHLSLRLVKLSPYINLVHLLLNLVELSLYKNFVT